MDMIQSALAADAVLEQRRSARKGAGAPDFYIEMERTMRAARRLFVTLGAIAATAGVLVSVALVATGGSDVLLARLFP